MKWRDKPVSDLTDAELREAERFIMDNRHFCKVSIPDLRSIYEDLSFSIAQERVNRTMAALRAE